MRVLVVDDQEDLRMLLRVALSAGGFEVSEATSGEEALRSLASGPAPDVVVLDIQMPDVDGWQVLTTIRSTPETAELPVMMCTVKGSRNDAERAWRLGCDAYVTKPFSVGELIEHVRAVGTLSSQARESVRHRALMDFERDAVDGRTSTGVR